MAGRHDLTGTSWSGSTQVGYVTGYTMTFTIWTVTPYEWTAESAHTAPVVCS